MMTRIRLIALLIAVAAMTPLRGLAREVNFAKVKFDAGKNIAFVCDGSRWQKDKIDDLADELNVTVQSLSPDQRVAILFFADDKVFGPNQGRPLPATDENKQAIRSWLRRVKLGREPTPLAGINQAFSFKPDTVVFISDGEFRTFQEVLDRVAELNKARTAKLHTIGFFATAAQDDSRSFVEFMKKLANDNGGQFHVVYADELKHTPR
jgi:hypothetical protein